MNTITVTFVPCEPAPLNGYNVQWRVFGSGDAFTDAGNFTTSPAVFTDDTNPNGTQYEGKIRSDNSESGIDNFCNDIYWDTAEESGGGGLGIALEARYSSFVGSHCTLPGNTVYTDDGTIATGKTVYQDSAMTIVLNGFNFISDLNVGTIFNIDSSTGIVGSTTGDTC